MIETERRDLQYQRDATGAAALINRTGARLLRQLFANVSPAGSRGRLTVLIFHRVHEQPDPIFPNDMHAEAFRRRLNWVRSWFNVIPLADAVAALARDKLPERALAITFDDGYANNHTVAMPILRQLGLHATFFISTGFLDGGCMWNDTLIEAIRRIPDPRVDLSPLGFGPFALETPEARRQAIMSILREIRYLPTEAREARVQAIAAATGTAAPTDLMMTTAQVRDLAAAGMGIGGHTITHPILAKLDEANARREIADGCDALEGIVRQPIKLFAYPNGKPSTDYTAAHVKIARELGFDAAMSTSSGAARAGDDLHQLPRFTPWERNAPIWAWRLLRNFHTRISRVPV